MAAPYRGSVPMPEIPCTNVPTVHTWLTRSFTITTMSLIMETNGSWLPLTEVKRTLHGAIPILVFLRMDRVVWLVRSYDKYNRGISLFCFTLLC